MKLGYVLAMCGLLLACEGSPTEAVVQVDADEALRMDGYRLCMRVLDPASSALDGEVCLDSGEYTWPATMPVNRLSSSVRDDFQFEAELLDGSSRMAIARARVRFIPGQTGELRLTLSAACGGACGEGTTCIMGGCEPACFELGPPAGISPSSPTECWAGMDGGVRDGGDAGAGGDAGPCTGIPMADGGCRCSDGLWWEVDFDVDPTSLDVNGDLLPDWRVRDDTPFPAADLRDGVWRATGMTVLDTNPGDSFDSLVSVHVRFRSINSGGRAILWINADVSPTSFGAIHADLSLQPSGLQELVLFGRSGSTTGSSDVELGRFGDLPNEFVDTWLLLEPATNHVTIWLPGMRAGPYSYEDVDGVVDVLAATLWSSGGEVDFDYARIESCPDGVMTPDGLFRP